MSPHLHQPTVLVLNRNWQAIHVKTAAEAFCMLASGSARGLDIAGDGTISPVAWDQWLTLPIRDHDQSVRTPRGVARSPTVIVVSQFAGVPLRRAHLNRRSLWQRDGGRCQYTGRLLRPQEGSIDHVIPRSRGGPNTWENCVLAHRDVNSRKADRLPEEAGLRLLARPQAPKALPSYRWIRNTLQVRDWEYFLPSYA